MKIATVTFTGADDHTSIEDLQKLSNEFPLIEWGILFSKKRAGTPRYPSQTFMQALSDHQRRFASPSSITNRLPAAAHLCGVTMRDLKTSVLNKTYDDWLDPFGLSEHRFNTTFQRTQLNFDPVRDSITPATFSEILDYWMETMDGALITQHNTANANVWTWGKTLKNILTPFVPHQVLHDASGGKGIVNANWNAPINGIVNGYAGGFGPDNVVDILQANATKIGEGLIWIDMEGSLRSPTDTFCLNTVQTVMEHILDAGKKNQWFL